LQKPPFDEVPWDEAVNGNMDILDSFISRYMTVPNFAGAWSNDVSYVVGQNALDVADGLIYTVAVTHTSASAPTTFAQDRTANPTYWEQSIPAAPSSQSPRTDVGRNKVVNGTFGIWQRGAGPFTGNYTADQWYGVFQGADATTYTQQTFTDPQRVQIENENSYYYLRNVFVGNGGDPTSMSYVQQFMEGVRRFANKTITVSFWAAASVAGLKLGVNLEQFFGAGGTASPLTIVLPVGRSVTLTTEFVRYEMQIVVPSIAGKVTDTEAQAWTSIDFFYSSAADNNAQAGNIGVQSGTIDLWGVQVENGSSATELEDPGSVRSLQLCQRFYFAMTSWVGTLANPTVIVFPVAMKREPSPSGGGAGFAVIAGGGGVCVSIGQTVAAVQAITWSAEF